MRAAIVRPLRPLYLGDKSRSQLNAGRFSTLTQGSAVGDSAGGVFKRALPSVVYNNLGLGVFLGVITGIGGMIYRTSAGSSNFNEVADP